MLVRSKRKAVRVAASAVFAAIPLTLLAAPLAALPAAAVGAPATSVQQVCAAPKPGFRACMALRLVTPAGTASPLVTQSGYGPSDLASAYNLPSTGGAGETIGIVDAMNQPNAASDLATYRSNYGLPACTVASGCFRQVNQSGATSPLPANDSGWGEEIDLDIDMASAICPQCHIVLVEATSASDANLGTAVNTAVSLGANVVSNSYGGGESSSDPSTTSSYYNHPGVLITASAGDGGYGVEYPAAATTVLAVGGTSLSRSSTTRGWTETVWGSANNADGGTGSGCSAVETKPSWQHDTGCTKRTVADTSAVADPNTGVAVYDSAEGGWLVFGGTSVASPLVAATYALTGHASATPQFPYANPTDEYDVTSGTNGSCGGSYLCTGEVGYDGPTGMGTPNGTAMAGGTVAQDFSLSVSPSSASVAPGGSTSATVSTATVSGAAQTVSLTASGLPAGATATLSPTSVTSGSSSSLSIATTAATAPGSYTVTITGAGTSATHTATFALTVTGTTSCASGQKLANPGFESGTASWSSTPAVIGQNGPAEPAHSGTWDAWLDGYGTTHTDTLSQSVKIPSGCTNYSLSFWLHIDTAETTTTTAYDKLTVKLGTTTLATYSNLNHATGYSQKTFNISGFAGQTVTLLFTGTEDSSLQTSFVIDDTAVTVS